MQVHGSDVSITERYVGGSKTPSHVRLMERAHMRIAQVDEEVLLWPAEQKFEVREPFFND